MGSEWSTTYSAGSKRARYQQMRDLRAVPNVKETKNTRPVQRDLEAETAHRINMLVARTRTWRNGSVRPSSDPATGVEVAAS